MSKGEPNCVVMGDAECDFTYDAMNEAFRVLTALDDPLIITLGFGFGTILISIALIFTKEVTMVTLGIL